VAVASFVAAVLTEIHLCNVCSCQEILRRNGRGQGISVLGVIDSVPLVVSGPFWTLVFFDPVRGFSCACVCQS
jgi:hypothetical protein